MLPAFEDGRGWDAVRHYFRAYPGELPYPGVDLTTRQARKAIGIQKPRKRRKTGTDRDAVLRALAKL